MTLANSGTWRNQRHGFLVFEQGIGALAFNGSNVERK
jgi:hypothetical protein